MTLRKGEKAFDGWSVVHVASGVALATVGMRAVWAIGLLISFEVLEGLLRRIKTQEGGLFEYESWKNIVADILVGAAGFYAAQAALGGRSLVEVLQS